MQVAYTPSVTSAGYAASITCLAGHIMAWNRCL